jgi:hypothetical protein
MEAEIDFKLRLRFVGAQFIRGNQRGNDLLVYSDRPHVGTLEAIRRRTKNAAPFFIYKEGIRRKRSFV